MNDPEHRMYEIAHNSFSLNSKLFCTNPFSIGIFYD
jgi:hypothetical protein